jgi:hypothetical protein
MVRLYGIESTLRTAGRIKEVPPGVALGFE